MGAPPETRAGTARTRIVELVGPAGCGKTTLTRALRKRSQKVALGPEIELRKPSHLPTFIGTAPSLLPVLLRDRQAGRGFSWDEIKMMAYLQGWDRVYSRQADGDGVVVLLDHGPVFKLATLDTLGPPRMHCGAAQSWWEGRLKRWAETLDMVIWLDAPDAALKERINKRDQRHMVKGKSEQEVFRFLARYRVAYEQILARLTASAGPALLRYDTSQASAEEIVEDVIAACQLGG